MITCLKLFTVFLQGAPVPEVVASFPGEAATPSSIPVSHLSTPPISPSASQPPSLPASNVPQQPLTPEAPQDYEVKCMNKYDFLVPLYFKSHSSGD